MTTRHTPIELSRRSLLVAGALAFSPSLAFARAATPRRPLAADDTGPAGPARFHRFKVGSIECVAVNDGSVTLGSVQPTFAASASKEALDAALDKAFHPRDKALLEFNAIALKLPTAGGGTETVLVDCGYGDAGAPALGHVQANLRAAGITPESVDTIVISHAHGDHVNGVLNKDGSLAYPNARYVMSKVEHDFWTGNPDLSKVGFPEQQKKEFIAGAQKHIAAMKASGKKLELIDGSSKVFSAIEFVPTPGHTPGHTSFVLRDGKDELFILADVAHNHVVMFADPSWGPVFDTEPDVATATRARMWDRLASDRSLVMAFHLPWPGLGHVRRDGKGYEWVIAATGL
ncbi:MAG: MBL fold metallo-hydrolase [Phycisphaerae bacterium]|jgi:glyoxylase-like metal-dependent hydrolase (beta-lactamase superfamily II)|nr:MBL fold metallo-hydrolase [Phycisphaerae bacterium]